MLAAAQRLRRRDEFTAAVRGGRRASRGGVVVHLSMTEPVPAADAARAGFVVPKAVGNAVVRNRVRRRLRHLVRSRLAALPPGTDVVVRALPSSADRGYEELAADLDAALAAAARPRRPKAERGAS